MAGLPVIEVVTEILPATIKLLMGKVGGETMGKPMVGAHKVTMIGEAAGEVVGKPMAGAREVTVALAMVSLEVGHLAGCSPWRPWAVVVSFMTLHLVLARCPIHYLGGRLIASSNAHR